MIGSITFPFRPKGLFLLSSSSFFENLMLRRIPSVTIVIINKKSNTVVQALTGRSICCWNIKSRNVFAMMIYENHGYHVPMSKMVYAKMIKLIAITIAVIAISNIVFGKELQKVSEDCVCYCPKQSGWSQISKFEISNRIRQINRIRNTCKM